MVHSATQSRRRPLSTLKHSSGIGHSRIADSSCAQAGALLSTAGQWQLGRGPVPPCLSSCSMPQLTALLDISQSLAPLSTTPHAHHAALARPELDIQHPQVGASQVDCKELAGLIPACGKWTGMGAGLPLRIRPQRCVAQSVGKPVRTPSSCGYLPPRH